MNKPSFAFAFMLCIRNKHLFVDSLLTNLCCHRLVKREHHNNKHSADPHCLVVWVL